MNLIVIALGIFGWPTIAFIARGEILRIRELEFVQASKALGASNSRILFRHIVPNMLSPIIVIASLAIAGNILTEVVISFLGFGTLPHLHGGFFWRTGSKISPTPGGCRSSLGLRSSSAF